MPDLISLEGKVALVTGATRGIGRAIATTLYRQGASVIVSGRDEEGLATLCGELQGGIGECHPVAGDIAQTETADQLAKAAFTKFRRLDILVNNAGMLTEGMIGMIKVDAIDQTLSVNLRSTLLLTQAAVRLMRRNGGGSIVNLSSIMGRFGNPGLMAYSASKAGIIGASMAAAKELAQAGIRVNVVAPGVIDSDMTRAMTDAVRKDKLASIGMGQIGDPQDVANVVLFLVSDLSRYVTGQVIGVDGGMIV